MGVREAAGTSLTHLRTTPGRLLTSLTLRPALEMLVEFLHVEEALVLSGGEPHFWLLCKLFTVEVDMVLDQRKCHKTENIALSSIAVVKIWC